MSQPLPNQRFNLTAKQNILLAIHGAGNIAHAEQIARRLGMIGVGFKPAENEIRARLSELAREGLVFHQGDDWFLTGAGQERVTEMTSKFSDEELELFGR
jgi:hypothetical protein